MVGSSIMEIWGNKTKETVKQSETAQVNSSAVSRRRGLAAPNFREIRNFGKTEFLEKRIVKSEISEIPENDSVIKIWTERKSHKGQGDPAKGPRGQKARGRKCAGSDGHPHLARAQNQAARNKTDGRKGLPHAERHRQANAEKSRWRDGGRRATLWGNRF